jgi:adenine-specific DNA-methyltransferase
LRGRDIKKYSYDFADIYLIATFPSLKIDIDNYPSVKQHLLSFGYDRLKQTGDVGARKKSNNKWFETQDSIGYWEDFSKQKIVWIELVDKGRFAIDTSDKFLTLNGTFIMTGNDLEFICAVLNNPITSWHFNTFCISSGVGTNQWRELYVRDLLIPNVSIERKNDIIRITKNIVALEKAKKDYTEEINELNKLIYNLFELDAEEINFIEIQ